MKKSLVILVVLVMAGVSLYAEGPFFGAKVGVGIGFHGNGNYIDDLFEGMPVDEKSGAAFALSPHGGYYFTDKIAVQTELSFMFGQKKTWKATGRGVSVEVKGKYSSLDIPFLIRFDFVSTPALFGILAGPYISIPLGDIDFSGLASTGYESESAHDTIDPEGVTAGIAAGLYGGYPIGPGRIIGDVRVIMDFSAIKGKDSAGVTAELIKRQGLNITVGYELLLGGRR
jgi:hypothetical protein